MTLKQTYQRAQQKSVKDFFNTNERAKSHSSDNFFTDLIKKKPQISK